jgi:WD40 repeat protein
MESKKKGMEKKQEYEEDNWGEVDFKVIGEHTNKICCVCINEEGNRIVSGSYDNTVKIWEIKNGIWGYTKTLEHTTAVKFVSISAAGNIIVSSSKDGIVKIWEMNEQQNDWTCKETIQTIPVIFCNNPVCISRDGTKIVCCYGITYYKKFCMNIYHKENNEWNYKQYSEIDACVDYIYIDEEKIIFLSTYQVFISSIPYPLDSSGWYNIEKVFVSCFCVSKTGKTIVFGTVFGCVFICNETQYDTRHKFVYITKFQNDKHKNTVSSVCISANEQIIVSGSYDSTVKIWEKNKQNDWTCLKTLKCQPKPNLLLRIPVISVCISGNDVIAGNGKQLVIFKDALKDYFNIDEVYPSTDASAFTNAPPALTDAPHINQTDS